MSGPAETRRSVRYFCTAGNGMESFLVTEVKHKLAAEQVRQVPGKVLFSSCADINTVCELKAAERLFLLLRLDSPVLLPAHIKPAKAASVLQSRVLGDRDRWSEAAATWRRLQGELADQRRITRTPITPITPITPVAVPMPVPGRTGGTEGGGRREEVTVQREESEDDQTLERKRKRKRDDEENTETAERKRKRDDEEDDEEERRRTEGKLPAEHVTPKGGGEVTLRQPSRSKPHPPHSVSFRISCKCTGALSRYFSSQDVSRVMASGLRRLLGWTVDLKNPQLEVNVNLSDDHCLLGFPLTRLPLANRSYMRTTGLRSTVAWAMTSLAHIQPGWCVLDPMCGTGTVLIEAAQEHQAVRFVGVDIDDGQLQRANENVEFAKLEDRIDLLKASSMTLPLTSSSVDAVVCDLPFGRKFGTKTNMAADLPAILKEMERVLGVGGSLVLLLSPQLSSVLKKLLTSDTKPRTGKPDGVIQQEVRPKPDPDPDPQPGPEPGPRPPDPDLQPGPEPGPPPPDPQPGPEPGLPPPDLQPGPEPGPRHPDPDPQPGPEPGPPPPDPDPQLGPEPGPPPPDLQPGPEPGPPAPDPDPQLGPEPGPPPPDLQPGPEPGPRPPDLQPGPEPGPRPPDLQPGPEPGPRPPLWSLEHRETFRVSLGAIDGLIHKYVKIHS